MKLLKSHRFIVIAVLVSYLFQWIGLPYAQAQRGIFVREGDVKRDSDGDSFRTRSDREDLATPDEVPQGVPSGLDLGNVQSKSQGGVEGPGGSSSGMGMGMTGGLLYQVHILGEVRKPGTYRVTASTRVSEAIKMAGGLKKNGSERNIEVRTPGGGTKRIDLLSYKTFGKLQDNPYLMDNEVIFIPLKQKVIEIEGALNRPGIYEVKGERNLSDAIRLAGGYSQGVAHKEPIRVIRYDEDGKKNVLEIQNSPEALQSTELLNADVIVIPHIFTTENTFDYNLKKLPNDNIFYPSYEDRVFIIGAVEVPGAYAFNPYYHMRNYLALAGGTTRMAKGYVKVVTEDGKTTKVKPDQNLLINPGDTLYIPEKALSRETWISLLTTIASLGLSVANTAIILSTRNN